MSRVKMTGKDMLLLFLYSPGRNKGKNEPIIGRTRITKMMFLFDEQLKKDFEKDCDVSIPEFIPYLYGPYSSEVFRDLFFLMDNGFIIAEDTNIPVSQNASHDESVYIQDEEEMGINDEFWIELYDVKDEKEKSYSLTKKGKSFVQEQLWEELTDNQRSLLERFKHQINSMDLDALLRYIYGKYPEYTTESLIRDKYC